MKRIVFIVAVGIIASACVPHERVHHHSFEDADVWAERFEDPARDQWQKPDEVIAALALEPDAVVADIGSATGYFPVRLAGAVPEGRVWGADIEPSMVRYLNRRARENQIDNLFSVLARPEDPLLPEPVDLVLIVNTYHHIGGRLTYFENLKSYMRTDARLVIIDFTKESPIGPPPEARLTPAEVTTELERAGYVKTKTHTLLPHQYFIEYRRRL